MLVALGFLSVGDRYMGMQNDIINDQIDVVTKGFLGLTVSCARCHDHKFDPIPQEDYYSLHGIFASSDRAGGVAGDRGRAGDQAIIADYEQQALDVDGGDAATGEGISCDLRAKSPRPREPRDAASASSEATSRRLSRSGDGASRRAPRGPWP